MNGATVRVISTKKKKYKETIGKLGTVVGVMENSKLHRVHIDGLENSASMYGDWWFEPDELEVLECMEENEMSTGRNDVRDIKDYKTVELVSNTYINIRASIHKDLICEGLVGKKVAVTDYNNGEPIMYDVAAIVETTQLHKFEVVALIDMEKFKAIRAREQEKADLMKQMKARIAQLQEEQIFELFAEKDNTLAELLAKFKGVK